VTATGADDSIDPKDLKRLQEEFSFVEWGILVSEAKVGGRRFPSEEWIAELCGDPTTMHGKELGPEAKLNISVHLCGRYVRQVCKGNFGWTRGWVKKLLEMAQRVQLNFHARSHQILNIPYVAEVIRKQWPEKQVILQADGVNNHIAVNLHDAGCDVALLYDRSGGAGILPDTWPRPDHDLYCGYAGGLSAGNVVEQLELIYEQVNAVHDLPVWIDAETHLRSEDNATFSIDKVYRYLSRAEPFALGVRNR
jgi:hypothetical protein